MNKFFGKRDIIGNNKFPSLMFSGKIKTISPLNKHL